jgi:hypothetical protein
MHAASVIVSRYVPPACTVSANSVPSVVIGQEFLVKVLLECQPFEDESRLHFI